jgi:hypothetical protein
VLIVEGDVSISDLGLTSKQEALFLEHIEEYSMCVSMLIHRMASWKKAKFFYVACLKPCAFYMFYAIMYTMYTYAWLILLKEPICAVLL